MLPRAFWRSKWRKSARHLELAWIYDFAIFVAQLEDVNAAVEVGEVDNSFRADIIEFEHLFTHETVDLEIAGFVVVLLKIEVDDGSGRVGIKLDDPWIRRPAAGRDGTGLALHLEGDEQD